MTLRKQYDALIKARFETQEVEVTGFERGSLAVRLLSEAEECASRTAAHKHLEAKCKADGVRLLDHVEIDSGAFERERMVQVVSRAFVSTEEFDEDFEDAKPAFEVAQIRAMDTVLVDELFDVYLAYQSAKTIRVEFRPQDVDDFVAEIKKSGGEAVLATLDETALRTLVLAIVRRP